MTFAKVASVMYFVNEPRTAASWYAKHLFGGISLQEEAGFSCVQVGGVEVGFHPAEDGKNPPGGGSVVYWRVENFLSTREALLAAGCEPWRGPLRLTPTRIICQLRDPFRNIIGLESS